MSGRLQGKRVIVTGAVAGIGRAVTAAFIEAGARVAIADLSERGLETALELGACAHFLRCDVSNSQEVAAMVQAAVAWLGGLDVLVNNAGIQLAGRIEQFDPQLWDHLMAVNVRGCFLVTRAAIRHLRDAGGGSIINTASLAAWRSGPGLAAYAASKGAIVAFSNTAALELAPDRIRVNSVCPGFVDTPFNQPAIDFVGGQAALDALVARAVPLARQAQPREIAPLYVYLASDEASYVTAQSWFVDGGIQS